MEGVAVTLVKGNRPGIVKARQLTAYPDDC